MIQDIFEIFNKHFNLPFHSSVLVFSVFLLIIFISPIIFRRLRIPEIIGLIIFGMVVGPHAFNLIEKNSAVDLLSTIGLLYLMFIAGLELDLNKFIKYQHKSLIFGFFTFIVPLAIGLPVCYYFLGFEFNTSFLIASMFSTHTLVAYPIVSRLRITNNEAVSITVGGTIFTDTAVLIILAFISGSAENNLNDLWMRLLVSLIIFLVIVIFLVPFLTRIMFSKPDLEKNMHFIYVLLVVFLCAFLSELAGLEPIIGAFAAGLALNKFIPRNSSLMNRLEFIGNSLFIPFFLISVGMIINLKVLSTNFDAIIITITLIIVALFGKWAAAFITALVLKYNSAQRKLIFGLSSSHAAATIAVILVGYKFGIIDDKVLNATILLILVTCLVASFVTESAAKKVILLSKQAIPAEIGKLEQKILVPLANPDSMSGLLDFATAINDHVNKPHIIGLSVIEDNEKASERLNQAKKVLDDAINHVSAVDQIMEAKTTIDRNIAGGITRVSKEVFATEIVIGWPQRQSISDIIFGRIVDGIIEQTQLTVFILRIDKPLNLNKEIKVICPPYSEMDTGFTKWLDRVFRLVTTLNQKITFISTYETNVQIELFALKQNLNLSIYHIPFTNWNNTDELFLNVMNQDLIILITPRRKSVSFHPVIGNISRRTAKRNSPSSMIIIYPEA